MYFTATCLRGVCPHVRAARVGIPPRPVIVLGRLKVPPEPDWVVEPRVEDTENVD